MTEYLRDPPFYDLAVYEFDPDKTVVMIRNDFMRRFMALTYTTLRFVELLQDGVPQGHLPKTQAAGVGGLRLASAWVTVG